jgi:hypothetical protein
LRNHAAIADEDDVMQREMPIDAGTDRKTAAIAVGSQAEAGAELR